VLSQTELRDLVTELLAKLPAREREAFVLRELEQLSTEQVALAMDVEESTVRSLTTLARRRMRELLAPHVEREARDA
jgi:RNA polymerase sigma-70 factor (ECF subfamily)